MNIVLDSRIVYLEDESAELFGQTVGISLVAFFLQLGFQFAAR